MYTNTVTLAAQDLVHYCAAIVHELIDRWYTQPDPVEIPEIGGDMLASVLPGSDSRRCTVKSMRELLSRQVENVSRALEAHDTKSALALELRRVLKGKRSGAGLLSYAVKLWKTLIIIERNFNPRADFTTGFVWHTDDQEIVKPESRNRLDGSKIQEPVKVEVFIRPLDDEEVILREVQSLPDLTPDTGPDHVDRITKTGRPVRIAVPKGRLEAHTKDNLEAKKLGAAIPKSHQYTATEVLGLRSSTETVPASASGECTRARPFGQNTRFLSDGTPVGVQSFILEVLTRLSETEGPFDHVSDPLGYWIARPGPDVPAMSQNAWRVVEVIENGESGIGFLVLETGEPEPSDTKGWVFDRKVEIGS